MKWPLINFVSVVVGMLGLLGFTDSSHAACDESVTLAQGDVSTSALSISSSGATTVCVTNAGIVRSKPEGVSVTNSGPPNAKAVIVNEATGLVAAEDVSFSTRAIRTFREIDGSVIQNFGDILATSTSAKATGVSFENGTITILNAGTLTANGALAAGIEALIPMTSASLVQNSHKITVVATPTSDPRLPSPSPAYGISVTGGTVVNTGAIVALGQTDGDASFKVSSQAIRLVGG